MLSKLTLWWSRNWPSVIFWATVVYVVGGVVTAGYYAGRSSVKPALAVAEGQSAVATTDTANAKGALTAASERHTLDVTIKAIEKETGDVVAEAHVTGDINGALAGWSDGIDRMRAVDQANANAGPDKHP